MRLARQAKVHVGQARQREAGRLAMGACSGVRPPFRLPDFIEATGIAKIRQALLIEPRG